MAEYCPIYWNWVGRCLDRDVDNFGLRAKDHETVPKELAKVDAYIEPDFVQPYTNDVAHGVDNCLFPDMCIAYWTCVKLYLLT